MIDRIMNGINKGYEILMYNPETDTNTIITYKNINEINLLCAFRTYAIYLPISLDRVYSLLHKGEGDNIYTATADVAKYGWNSLHLISLKCLAADSGVQFYEKAVVGRAKWYV